MTSEHGFSDHSASDLTDWAEYRKHQETEEDTDEEDTDTDTEEFLPEREDVDWNYWAD